MATWEHLSKVQAVTPALYLPFLLRNANRELCWAQTGSSPGSSVALLQKLGMPISLVVALVLYRAS